MKQKLKDHVVINKKNLLKLLTKCAKMTEEGGDLIKRNGMNGTSASVVLPLHQTQAIQTALAGQRNINSSVIENHLHSEIHHQKDVRNISSCADATSSGGGSDQSESVEPKLVIQKNKGSSANDSDNNRTKNIGKTTTTPNKSLQSATGGSSNDRSSSNPGNITASGGRLQFFKGERNFFLIYLFIRKFHMYNVNMYIITYIVS